MRLFSRVLTVVLIACAALGVKKAPDLKEEVVQLEPLKISAPPVNSFPIELDVRVMKETRQVVSIVIASVQAESDAAAEGLQPGDEIIKINGQPVAGMDGRVNLEAQLGKLLINRPLGERIQLEVVTKRTKTVTLRSANLPKPR
ncbi:PDZ domain-containing protein [Oleiharenicola lentus]|uniref:PDZ domain-containing protein n=1 Tax=Oleiharenicola lentus TaxID=2508720 RepID=UPI003F664D5A